MTLQDLLKERKETMNRADAILSASERANRELTVAEQVDFDSATARVTSLDKQIKQKEGQNTHRHSPIIASGLFNSGMRLTWRT